VNKIQIMVGQSYGDRQDTQYYMFQQACFWCSFRIAEAYGSLSSNLKVDFEFWRLRLELQQQNLNFRGSRRQKFNNGSHTLFFRFNPLSNSIWLP
jgi:hypothetical protein